MTKLVLESKGKIQLCTFWLNDCLFGVNILDVKEVNSELGFTPIFHSSKKVCGYVNIRGSIHLVLNLRTLMGFEHKVFDGNCRVVLFKPEVGESFGVLVDRVGDVVDVEEDLIENRRARDDVTDAVERRGEHELGMGVYKLKDKLLVILNASLFLNAVRD